MTTSIAENRALVVFYDCPDLDKARQLLFNGMEHSTEIRQKASPVLEIIPRLPPDGVHHEVSDF